MNRINTKAVVLSKTDWKESSYIVDLLTEDAGRVSAKIFGAKKKGMPVFKSMIYDISIVVRDSGLSTVTELKPLSEICAVYSKRKVFLMICSMVEILKKSSISGSDTGHFFHIYSQTVMSLAKCINDNLYSLYMIKFLMRFLHSEGYWAFDNNCGRCKSKIVTCKSIYWDIEQGNFLCSSCVNFESSFFFSGRAIGFLNWIINNNPLELENKKLPFDVAHIENMLFHFIKSHITGKVVDFSKSV